MKKINYLKVTFLPPSKTDTQTINRMKRYGGFYDMYFKLNKKIVGLEKIKEIIKSGKKVIIGNVSNLNYIKCGLNYNDYWDGIIPVVKCSNHHRFIPGTRFDYGFMEVALRDGYCISYNFK